MTRNAILGILALVTFLIAFVEASMHMTAWVRLAVACQRAGYDSEKCVAVVDESVGTFGSVDAETYCNGTRDGK